MKVFVIYDDFDNSFIGDKVLCPGLKLPMCFKSKTAAINYIKEEYMKGNGKFKYSQDDNITWFDKDNEYHTFSIMETELV